MPSWRRFASRPRTIALLALALTGASGPVAHAGAGADAAPTSASLSIVMPLRIDAAGLRSFALAVSDPRSSLYARYASVAAISRRFGASASTRARVLQYLRSRGATDVTIDATGMLAEATLTVGLAERLFETPLARSSSADGSRFLAPASGLARAPTVPTALRGAVQGIVGLDTEPLATATATALATAPTLATAPATAPSRADAAGSGRAQAAQAGSSELSRTGTPAGCPAGQSAGEVNGNPSTAGFTPNQYLTAYDYAPLLSAGIEGQGERVALIEIDGFNPTDIDTFAQCFGLSVPALHTYGVGIKQLLAPGPEATLDLELLDASAPGLSGIDVYESKPDSADVLRALVAPLQNRGHKPQVVSVSLGICERQQAAALGPAGIDAAERSLQAATAAGVTYLAATGDKGSTGCEDSSGAPRDELAVNYPASSWWVTGVGATNLELTAANRLAGQVVWNDAPAQLAASGGGLSALFNRPPYQDGPVASNDRSVPDVSMLGDLVPGYAVYCTAGGLCSTPWTAVGGTSAAAPLLAGGVALTDQQLRRRGRQDLGFLNPLLYTLGRSSARAKVFSDVTLGDDDLGPFISGGNGEPLGCCTAKAGYDDASGWGSVDIAGFSDGVTKLVPYVLGKLRLGVPRHQHPVSAGHILATVTCARACDTGAFAKVTVGRAKPFEVDSNVYKLKRPGKKTISLDFSKAQLKSLRAALAEREKIDATIYGVNATPDGTIENRTRGQRLAVRS